MPNDFGSRHITELIRKFYASATAISPDKLNEREFGFGTFENKVAFRHMAFKEESELKKYLVDTAPAFVDYSAAYYEFPAARPMEKKGWLGSELRFDIDSNDIPTPCKVNHGKEWVCDECLEAAKQEVLKLINDFLISDFGFNEKEMLINFSGNRGYHVHVRKESVLMLDAPAREELSNYIFGEELDFNSFFTTVDLGHGRKQQLGPKPKDGGWRGKVANAFLDASHATSSLKSLGMSEDNAKWVFKNIVKVREQISQGYWDFYKIPQKEKEEVFGNLLHNQAIKQGNKIDKGVTRDPTHLMRLPNTIHGGAGLIAKKIDSLSALQKFEPMRDAIAFKTGELKVKADSKYKLIMNGEQFGPFRGETLTIPTYAATYLYLKGLATILSN